MSDDMSGEARAKALGEWLSAWRRKRGFNRPEAVNEALKYIPHAKISPDYLSKLEYGKRSLAAASPEVREALRQALKIPAGVWEAETGLVVPASPTPLQRGPISPVIQPIDLPLALPSELKLMVEQHGDKYPELHNETLLRALAAPRLFAGHSQGPQTADQWFEYFLMNRRWLPQ